MEGPMQEFKPSNQYCLLSRDMFKQIKEDLERIHRADNLVEAKQWGAFILERLKKKFDPPANAEQMQQHLHDKANYLAGHSDKKV